MFYFYFHQQPSDKDSGVYKSSIKTPQGTLDAETKINIKGMGKIFETLNN